MNIFLFLLVGLCFCASLFLRCLATYLLIHMCWSVVLFIYFFVSVLVVDVKISNWPKHRCIVVEREKNRRCSHRNYNLSHCMTLIEGNIFCLLLLLLFVRSFVRFFVSIFFFFLVVCLCVGARKSKDRSDSWSLRVAICVSSSFLLLLLVGCTYLYENECQVNENRHTRMTPG